MLYLLIFVVLLATLCLVPPPPLKKKIRPFTYGALNSQIADIGPYRLRNLWEDEPVFASVVYIDSSGRVKKKIKQVTLRHTYVETKNRKGAVIWKFSANPTSLMCHIPSAGTILFFLSVRDFVIAGHIGSFSRSILEITIPEVCFTITVEPSKEPSKMGL